MFEPQVQEFEKKYRVICPDIRGNGKSGKLTGNINTILHRQCDEMAELMDNIQIYVLARLIIGICNKASIMKRIWSLILS